MTAYDVSSMELYCSGSNQENRCVGHIRGDFGKSGDEYWVTFWEHEGINVAEKGCKEELIALVNALRKNLFKSRRAMRKSRTTATIRVPSPELQRSGKKPP